METYFHAYPSLTLVIYYYATISSNTSMFAENWHPTQQLYACQIPGWFIAKYLHVVHQQELKKTPYMHKAIISYVHLFFLSQMKDMLQKLCYKVNKNFPRVGAAFLRAPRRNRCYRAMDVIVLRCNLTIFRHVDPRGRVVAYRTVKKISTTHIRRYVMHPFFAHNSWCWNCGFNYGLSSLRRRCPISRYNAISI